MEKRPWAEAREVPTTGCPWATPTTKAFGWSKCHTHRIRMYAIYGNIDHQYTPNVRIYTRHGSYGIGFMDRISDSNLGFEPRILEVFLIVSVESQGCFSNQWMDLHPMFGQPLLSTIQKFIKLSWHFIPWKHKAWAWYWAATSPMTFVRVHLCGDHPGKPATQLHGLAVTERIMGELVEQWCLW